MKRLRGNKAMQNELIVCISSLALGAYLIVDTGFKWQGIIRVVGLLAFGVYTVLFLWKMHRDKHMTPEEKRELDREIEDERSKMLRNMSERYCWWLEEVLLLIACVVFLLRGQLAIYSILYVVFVVRMVVSAAIRWWLDLKY